MKTVLAFCKEFFKGALMSKMDAGTLSAVVILAVTVYISVLGKFSRPSSIFIKT